MTKSPEEYKKLRAKIIVRAWKDPKFKEKLIKNPRAAMQEMGLEVQEKITVQVVEDNKNTVTFVLPQSVDASQELPDSELERLAAGMQGTGLSDCIFPRPGDRVRCR
ncbi:MAG: NHLP leader peptide family RiPP precursor [Chlamydiales bacterium]